MRVVAIAGLLFTAACQPLGLFAAGDGGIDMPNVGYGYQVPDMGGAMDLAGVNGPGPNGYPAAHLPQPTINPHSGTVLSNVKMVSISYSGFNFQQDVFAWGDFVFQSKWFTVGQQYGVHSGSHAAKVTLPSSAPQSIYSDQIPKLINNLITAGTVPAPSSNKSDQYYYVLYIPLNTTVIDNVSDPPSLSCVDFLGYHGSAIYNGHLYPYAVNVDCGNGLNDLFATASHELLEASTDPYDSPNAGFYLDVGPPNLWYADDGNEIGDLCDGEPNAKEGGFEFQPIWSAAAALVGQDPCAPATSSVYYNVTASPATMPTVAAGSTVTFTITGWSLAQTYDWSLRLDLAGLSDLHFSEMQPALSANTINNGKSVTVTLKVPSNAASGLVGAIDVHAPRGLPRSWPVGFIVK